MVYYAVIDTNVFISALLSKRADAATVRVLDAMFDGKIVPLYHEDILAEYPNESLSVRFLSRDIQLHELKDSTITNIMIDIKRLHSLTLIYSALFWMCCKGENN